MRAHTIITQIDHGHKNQTDLKEVLSPHPPCSVSRGETYTVRAMCTKYNLRYSFMCPKSHTYLILKQQEKHNRISVKFYSLLSAIQTKTIISWLKKSDWLPHLNNN